MKTPALLAVALGLCLGSPAALAAPADTAASLPLDSEREVGGIKVACTGIGQTRRDPQWAAYPVRVEVSAADNTYLAGEEVQVRDAGGKVLLHVSCEAPWVLLKLSPGAYVAEVRLLNSAARPRSSRFVSPKTGQQRVVVQFPDA